MAEFGENIDMFDEVKQDLQVKQTLEWMTFDSNDLLKRVVDISEIEKFGKKMLIDFFFLKSAFQ